MSEQSARKHEEIPHHMQFFKWAQMNKLSTEAIGIINSYCHVPNKEVRHFFKKLMEYYNKQMLYEKRYYEEKERKKREEEKAKRDRERHEEKKRRYYEDKKRREKAAAGPSHASAYVDREQTRSSVDEIRKEAGTAHSSPRVFSPAYQLEDDRRHASSACSSPRVSSLAYHVDDSRNHVNSAYSSPRVSTPAYQPEPANTAYASPRVSTPAYQPDDDDIQFICEQPSKHRRGSGDMAVKQEVAEAGPSRQEDVAPIADYPESPPYHSPPRPSTPTTKQPAVPIVKPAAAAAPAAPARVHVTTAPSSKSDQRPTTSSTKPSVAQTKPALKKPVAAPQSQKHVNFNERAPAVRHIPRRDDVPEPRIEPLTRTPLSVSVHAAPTPSSSIMDPRHKKEPVEPRPPVVPAAAPAPPVTQPSSLQPTRHIKTERLSAADDWASVEEIIGSPRPAPVANFRQKPPPTTSTTPAVSPNDMLPINTLRIKQEPIDATETAPPAPSDPAVVQILSSYLVKLNQQVNRLNVIKGQARSKKLQSAIFNSEVEELADPGVTFKLPYFKKLTEYVSGIIMKMNNEFKRLNMSSTASLEASLQSVKDDVDKILRRVERAVHAHEGAGPSHQTSSSTKRKNSEDNEGKNKKKRDDVSRSPDSTTH